MRKPKRQKWYVDPQVQSGMMFRLIMYWAMSLMFVSLTLALINTMSNPGVYFFRNLGNVWVEHWPVFLAISVLMPFALNDIVRFSNRFVGPIYRMRREMRNFRNGDSVQEIAFREDDYWREMADEFNFMVRRVNESVCCTEEGEIHTPQLASVAAGEWEDEQQQQA